MVQAGGPKPGEERPIGGAVMRLDLPEGAKVRLRNGAIAEVTANPRDGGWIFIRYLEFPEDSSRVGEEDMAFCADVRQAF